MLWPNVRTLEAESKTRASTGTRRMSNVWCQSKSESHTADLLDMSLSAANCSRAAVGSDPAERTKMRGVVEEESAWQAPRSKVGGSTNLRPNCASTKSCTAGTTLSGLHSMALVIHTVCACTFCKCLDKCSTAQAYLAATFIALHRWAMSNKGNDILLHVTVVACVSISSSSSMKYMALS